MAGIPSVVRAMAPGLLLALGRRPARRAPCPSSSSRRIAAERDVRTPTGAHTLEINVA